MYLRGVGGWDGHLQCGVEKNVHTIKSFSFFKLSIYTWGTSVCSFIGQELCESRGGRPGLSVLTSLMASVHVKIY